jgi:hypothetical protein
LDYSRGETQQMKVLSCGNDGKVQFVLILRQHYVINRKRCQNRLQNRYYIIQKPHFCKLKSERMKFLNIRVVCILSVKMSNPPTLAAAATAVAAVASAVAAAARGGPQGQNDTKNLFPEALPMHKLRLNCTENLL